MHEMALISRVAEMVLDEVEGMDGIMVSEVHLTIGQFHDVVEDFVPGLFAFLTKGTVAENAQIFIKRIPYTAICDECGYVLTPTRSDPESLTCPQCGAYRNYHLCTGREFIIENIVVDEAIRPGAEISACA